MRDVDRALTDITDIRSQIAASKMFRGFGPAVLALTALLALVIASFQSLWPNVFAPTPVYLLGLWIFAAFIAVILIGAEMFARSRRLHGGLADSMNANTIENFLPIGAVGAVIGIVVMLKVPSFSWALPGIWQLLVAIGIFSAVKFLPKRIHWVAAWYFIAGAATLIIGSTTQTLSPWMMGIPFIVGQLLMSAILYTALEKPNV